MTKLTIGEERRAKTSINLRQSLRNAAIKHLIDMTGQTEISEAVERALTNWIADTKSGDSSSTAGRKGPLQIVVQSPRLATDVTAQEHAIILKLLTIMRGGDRRTESAIRQIIESTAGHTEAPEVPRDSQTHDKGRSKESPRIVKRSSGDKKPSA